MSSATRTPGATLDDLHRFEGKAELIAGRIVPLMATGYRPGLIAKRILLGLERHSELIGRGIAFGDNVGFAVPELPSGRESFSPDTSFYLGPPPDDEMDFVPGPPTFAVEVRSKSDRGPAAEQIMAAKRSDYFRAGTLAVWDVDPQAGTIRLFRAEARDEPIVFASGQIAHAEPAVPAWRMAVDEIFA